MTKIIGNSDDLVAVLRCCVCDIAPCTLRGVQMGRQKHLEPAALGETWDIQPPRSAVLIETILDEEKTNDLPQLEISS